MHLRAGLLVVGVILSACASGWHPASRKPAPGPSAGKGASEKTGGPRARGGGAAPGDERGPGGFVARKEEKTFYGASGGQLWYYVNLYYWVPEGLDTSDLWIREEVVEQFKDLRRWPDAAPATTPPAKTTNEWWEVGETGRTVTIDNHKDFFLAAENYCAGAIVVTMTLELGRLRVADSTGAWARPRAHYVLEKKDYGKGKEARDSRFEPLRDEPITVWQYEIRWSSCPNRFVRSNWERLRVPEIKLLEIRAPLRDPQNVVTTEDR